MSLRTLNPSPARSPLSARNPNSLDLPVRSPRKAALTTKVGLEKKPAQTVEPTPQASSPELQKSKPVQAVLLVEAFGAVGVLETERGATPAVHKSEGRTACKLAVTPDLAPQTDWTAEEWAEWEEQEATSPEHGSRQWTKEEWAAWEWEWTAEEWAEWEAGAQEDESEECLTSAFGESGLLQLQRGATPEAHKLEGRFARPGSDAVNSLRRRSLGPIAPNYIPLSMRNRSSCTQPAPSDEQPPHSRAEGRSAAMRYLVPACLLPGHGQTTPPVRSAASIKPLAAAPLEAAPSMESLALEAPSSPANDALSSPAGEAPSSPTREAPSSVFTNRTVMYGARPETPGESNFMDWPTITAKEAEELDGDAKEPMYKPARTRWETLAGLRAIYAEAEMNLPHLPYGLNPPPPSGPRPGSVGVEAEMSPSCLPCGLNPQPPSEACSKREPAPASVDNAAAADGEDDAAGVDEKPNAKVVAIGLTEADILAMRVIDLRAALAKRNLPTKGRKAELQALLQEACFP
jgi:hypothetical protein